MAVGVGGDRRLRGAEHPGPPARAERPLWAEASWVGRPGAGVLPVLLVLLGQPRHPAVVPAVDHARPLGGPAARPVRGRGSRTARWSDSRSGSRSCSCVVVLAVLHRPLGQLTPRFRHAVSPRPSRHTSRLARVAADVDRSRRPGQSCATSAGCRPTDGGKITPGRLLRSDNLQTLTDAATSTSCSGSGLTDVVDLRSDYEAEREGPGPLAAHRVCRIHQFSLFREWREGVGEDKPDVRPEVLPEEALPWVDLEPEVELEDAVASVYFSYSVDRPDSVLAALRTIAYGAGRDPGALRGGQGPDRHRRLPRSVRGRGRAGRHRRGLRRQLRTGRGDRRPADVVADLRRQPARSADVVPPEPAGDHDRLPRPHRPRPTAGSRRC